MLSGPSTTDRSLSYARNGDDDPDTRPMSYDFLPSVSFDDLQTSIESASTDFKLTQFPSPTGEGSILEARGFPGTNMNSHAAPPTQQQQQQPKQQQQQQQQNHHQQQPPVTRNGRSGSLLRRPSLSSRQPPTATSTAPVDAPSAPVATRNRRQNHYPPVSADNNSGSHNSAARPQRKSIGPGDSPFDAPRQTQRRRPSLFSDRDTGQHARASADGPDPNADLARPYADTRAFKAKSVQPPPRSHQAGNAHGATLTPEQNRHSVLPPRSPHYQPSRGLTPGSGNPPKRVSMLPAGQSQSSSHYASGLGARTISPTDTKRAQRLSTMPSSHSLNQIINAPAPPAVQNQVRADSNSPSMIPRKTSVTPSSNRTTPDVMRKSYSSGLSVHSNTSFNSVRTSTGSLQPRLPASASNSRLPAPKTTTVHNPTHHDDEGDVPPVPAIPKAYESPKDAPTDAYFTEKKKTGSSNNLDGVSTAVVTGSITMPVMPDPTKVQRRPSARKSSFVPAPTQVASNPDRRVSTQPARKTLPPLSLPPINLAPINLPSSMTASTRPPLPPVPGRDASPPPSRTLLRTPTTPMTASKSSFFSKSRYDEAIEMPSLRSSSSVHHNAYHLSPTPPDPSNSDQSSAEDESKKPTISPFLSSSAPKGGFEADFPRRPKTSGEPATVHGLGIDEHVFHQKPAGPRPQHVEKPASQPPPKSPTPAPSAEDPQTPSSMSSLRRKLSMSWKRSTPKNGTKTPTEADKNGNPNQARQDSMPPPRIPVSANSDNLTNPKLNNVPALPKTSSNYLDSRRRKSSGASLSSLVAHDRHNSEAGPKRKEGSVEPTAKMPTARNPLSLNKIAKARTSSAQVRSEDYSANELDKDDKMAEDEMRKLGSRRKETEAAARTVDTLRKRASPKDRVGAHEAIRIAMLNIYERGEIIDYNDVYFCGTQNARKVAGDLSSDKPNFGYDDERGDYTIVPGDHLAYRYEIVDILGKGSFGQVVRCIDHKLGVLVAVKIIRNKKRFHQQALVEVNILQKLREWDPKNRHSMVNFTQSFYFRGHLCISTELLDMNLYELIKAHAFRGFSIRIIRRFTKQILSSLNMLKKQKVIHCDLKPENILLRHPLHAEIKVIDFGSSCFEHEKVYTYIQSRFYRSPEVILGMTYGLPIDMWSVGCILAELYTGVPIFPGENEQEQLACIMEVFGPPEKHLIEKSTRKKLFFDSMGKPRLTVSSKGRRRRPSSKTLQQAIKCDDEAFLDFLARCLRWDPERRLKPEDAIRHEFITGQKTVATTIPRIGDARANTNSPVKRHPTVSGAPRPLPEPPGAPSSNNTSSSVGSSSNVITSSMPPRVTAMRNVSPHKPGGGQSGNPAAVRRTSGATAPTAASTNRRTSTGTGNISGGHSGLPRAANRSVSNKSDLAALGATAAMSKRT